MRPEIDRELAQLYRHWKVEEAPPGLAERIVTHATALPQYTPWRIRLANALQPFLKRPQLALVPGMALAALLVIGLHSVQMQSSEDDLNIDMLLVAEMGAPDEFDF